MLRCTKQKHVAVNDIFSIFYKIYTHDFVESQKSPLFNYMLLVKVRWAIPKPWQIQNEINIENGVMFFTKFVPTLFC